jgi:hypothetical protein
MVFSRFEFIKFMNIWNKDRLAIREAIDDYISYVLLRDILASRYFILANGNQYALFFTQVTKLKQELQGHVIAALEGDVALENISPQSISDILLDSLTTDGFQPKRLQSIPSIARLALIRYFSESYQLCLVLDGLDHISIQDLLVHNDRQFVLNHILSNFDNLTRFRSYFETGMGVYIPIVVVIRENTLAVSSDRGRLDVDFANKDKLYRVGVIDARVATYNSILRTLGIWAGSEEPRIANVLLLANLFMTAVDAIMRLINRSVGSRESFVNVYEIFGGNLRVLFDFVRKLLAWFVEESVRSGLISIKSTTRAEHVFLAMLGEDGFRLLRRRKYRIVEILLFSDLKWFENAIRIEPPDQLRDLMMAGKSGEVFQRILENRYFTGFIDNIFNYHIDSHDNNADMHPLIEKIRIIQLLMDKDMLFNELHAALFSRLGYKSEEFMDTMLILIRAEMVKAKYTSNGFLISAAPRGQFVVHYLCHEMSYLEHVFHQTLFPQQLVAHVSDSWREASIDNWTVASIRNSFIFLTYLNFVESNKANGRSVPERLKLFRRSSERVSSTVQRILNEYEQRQGTPDLARSGAEELLKDGSQLEGSIAYRALKLIEGQVRDWDRASILIDSLRDRKGRIIPGGSNEAAQ